MRKHWSGNFWKPTPVTIFCKIEKGRAIYNCENKNSYKIFLGFIQKKLLPTLVCRLKFKTKKVDFFGSKFTTKIDLGPDHVQLTFSLKVFCRLKANCKDFLQNVLQFTLLIANQVLWVSDPKWIETQNKWIVSNFFSRNLSFPMLLRQLTSKS